MMARAKAGEKKKRGNKKKAAHLAKKNRSALREKSGADKRIPGKTRAKPKGKASLKIKEERTGRRRGRKPRQLAFPIDEIKPKADAAGKIPLAEKPPKLLSETKSTAAALGILEKGIKLIYQKDLKRARLELNSLLESYPQESEILARARTYLQICDREEASRKRPVVTSDQLYTLGVMEHNRGNFENAVTSFRQLLEKGQKGDYIYYSLAASLACSASISEALDNLRHAIALNEDNRIFAKNDSDFEQLRANNEFAELVGLAQESASESPQP